MTSESKASDLYQESVVIDGLNVSNWQSPAVYESLHTGNVTAINATIAVWEHYTETMDNITQWLRRFRERSDTVSQVTSVQDILDAKATGRTGVIFGWQNATPIENDLDRLDLFYRLGVGSSRSPTTSGTCWATAAGSGTTRGSATSARTP